MTSDPRNFTSNWYGPDVCNYNGVYCAPAPDDPKTQTVAGIDLNHADISGYLPEDLGLLTDLALFHINSNRFVKTLPYSFRHLKLLFELDISNNRFSGRVPSRLFDSQFDAIFINNNGFTSSLPSNLGNSTASVMVLANNNFGGSCIPASLMKMGSTLTQVILSNMGLRGCLQPNLGALDQLKVFDVSNNELVGSLPESMVRMTKLEQLNVANNRLSGEIPAGICALPRLRNFTYSFNFFTKEPDVCLRLPARGAGKNGRKNCIPGRPGQRSAAECALFNANPFDCSAGICPLQ
ncbi:Leucine-rich repeat extensin-like protein 6 [Linum grandiflorum]